MYKRPTVLILVLALLGIVVASRARAAGPLRLGVEGRANAHASIATAGSFVAVAWGAAAAGGATDIYVAASRDSGEHFSAPVRISTAASRAALSGEQPPRVALVNRGGGMPAITVLWTSKGTRGTRIVSARSLDGGRTFTAPAAVGDTGAAQGNRGWESAAALPDGGVAAIWLDHRDTVTGGGPAGDHAMHQHADAASATSDPTARAQLSKLWFARVDRPSSAAVVTAGVCYCCKTALAAGPDGALYAAWRHVFPGSRRDIAFARARDGRSFEPPVRVSDDQWQLDGCPENGPALAVDATNRIHLVWPTLLRENGRETLALFYSTSTDGRTFSSRQRVPTTSSAAYHPALALSGGRVLVAWEEPARGERVVRVTTIAQQGGEIRMRPIAVPDSAGSYPVLADTAAGPLLVWTRKDTAAASSVAVWRLGGW